MGLNSSSSHEEQFDIHKPGRSIKNGQAEDPRVLEVKNLSKHFLVNNPLLGEKVLVFAVDGVDLHVDRGETLGLVGESGSGKTTVGRCILRLIDPTEGEIYLQGEDLIGMNGRRLREIRRNMQMVFQDPADSLNPRFTCRKTLTDALRHSGVKGRNERQEQALALLHKVGMNPSDMDKFPHQFSGGQQQRIAIGRALAFEPILLVLDEPTASLDVSVQTQIANLLRDLQTRLGHSYILISHDLSSVRHAAQRVAVMYLGKLMEVGDTKSIFENPAHPYTQILIQSIPIPDPNLRREHTTLKGEIPSPTAPPPGCRFHTRCPLQEEVCRRLEPSLEMTESGTLAACHMLDKSIATDSWKLG